MQKSVVKKPTDNHTLLQHIIDKQNYVTLPLIQKLCDALREENISYCHWKSNNALERSANGDNDLDLLISRSDGTRFTEILFRLGFKQAKAPKENQMPSVVDYYGFDVKVEKIIHVHAHFQLILGHDMTKNYRLPIEESYLESAIQGDVFRIPKPEFEYIVFVIRMALKHLSWDVILVRDGKLKTAERKELEYLQARVNLDYVYNILRQYLPYIDVHLFDKCIKALQPACSIWTRMRTSHQLQSKLQSNARHASPIDTYLKLYRRVILAIHRRVLKSSSKYRLTNGGVMIALIGGDGAGKSTAIEGLNIWLSKIFDTNILHLGKPAWSWTTITIRGILKVGQLLGLYPVESSLERTLQQKSLVSPGYPWLIREVCLARDRFRYYRKARRYAARGGVVFLDRFPLPQIRIMDGAMTQYFINQLINGPQSERFMSPRPFNRLARVLVKLEERYYKQIVAPDILIILRVDPEIAVQRKIDEDPISVRARNLEMWEQNWQNTRAHLIDASKSRKEVLTELKTLIWTEL